MLYSKIAMKKIYLYISLVLVLSVNLYSCKEDETPVYPTENDELVDVSEDKTEMTVSTEKIDVIKDQSKALEIQSGAGDYKASVLDKSIAEVSVEGSAVIVKGLAQGETEMIVSDKNGSFKNVKVDVYLTDNLIIDQTEVNIELPFGKPAVKIINVTEGNGNYVVSSANKGIVTASVDGSKITLSAVAEGETEITVMDSHGLSAKVIIKVTINNSAFSSAELESIMTKSDVQYVLWPEEDFYKKSGVMLTAKNEDLGSFPGIGDKGLKQTGVYLRGTGKTALTVAFESDINYTLDKEESGYLYERDNDWTFEYKKVPCTFKVIKKDGSKSWAIFYTNGEEIVKGYMIFE